MISEEAAARLFKTALLNDQCAELWVCLTEGGTATVNGNGDIIMISGEALKEWLDTND